MRDESADDKASDERYRALAEHARDVITEIAADGTYLYASPSYAEVWGWEPAEVLGRSVLELMHPEDAARIAEVIGTAIASETPADASFRLRDKAGRWRWVESTGRPYRTESGEVRGVIVSRDVTDRVAAEHALQEQIEVERRIADLSRRFLRVAPAEFEDCVRSGLGVAGELAGADRSQFYLRDPGNSRFWGHYDWHAPGVEVRELLDVPSEKHAYPWSMGKLGAGEIIHLPRVADAPEEAAAEREGLGAQGVRSYLALPIRDEGRTLGFIDFFRLNERGWTSAEITRLVLISEVLTSAVRRLTAEQSRHDAEERFRVLTRHAHDAICELSAEGRVLYVSGSYEQLSGYTWDEMKDRDPWSLVHPDDRDRIRIEGAEAARRSGPTQLTYRLIHRDSGIRWLESTMKPFEDSSGEKRMAVVVRDVTERQTQRLELERQIEVEKRLADFSRSLLEAGADTIDAGIESGLEAAAALAGADRAFLVSSLGGEGTQAAVYDWHASDVPPREHAVGRGYDRRGWIMGQLERGESIRIPRVEEIPDQAREIREQLLASNIQSYLCLPINSDGKLQGVVGFHCIRERRDWSEADVTLLRLVTDIFTSALRRKGAEVRLVESQHRLLQAQKMEAVGTLAGGIAHDFNNQLTVMLANARYAMREAQGDDDVQQALKDLNRAAEHCAQLIRSLLAFSRRTATQARALEVGEVVDEARELLRPLIPSSIRFEVRARNTNVRIEADPTQLQQVLVNLVVNARDAMPDGGQLTLAVRSRLIDPGEARRVGLASPGGYVELLVRDTGTGMDESVRARIFEPFFTTKPLGKGTGLGLATAYGIVEQCGGVITIDSEIGSGSTFRVLLPRMLDPDEQVTAERPIFERVGAGTVLLVEDESSVRRLVSRILRGAGYEVLEAGDGAEALRIGRQNADRLDALVTDVDMPRMNGIELARRLARQRADLPVLFISGMAQEGLDGERSRFVPKPFTERVILEHLHDLLGTAPD